MRFPIIVLAFAAASAAPAAAQVASMQTSGVMADRNVVVVSSANLPGDGLLVVRSQARGEKPLAVVPVKAGVSHNIHAALSRPARQGETLEIVLHADYGVKGKFEPGVDPVALSAATRAP